MRAFRGPQLETLGTLLVYDSHSVPAGLTILQRFLGCFGHLLSKRKWLWMKNWVAYGENRLCLIWNYCLSTSLRTVRKARGTLIHTLTGQESNLGPSTVQEQHLCECRKETKKYHDGTGKLSRYNDWTIGWTIGDSLYRALMAVPSFTPRLLNNIPWWRPLRSRT